MGDISDWIAALGELYDRYGYLIVFGGAFAENTALLGLVLPGGTLALLGAFYARQGMLSLGWVIAFAWIGTVLGYHADYLFGRFVLSGAAQRWSGTRLGRRMRLAGRLRQARRFLARHGGKAILLSHTVGHVRSFVALSAGATRMPYRRFLAYELVAALLWNIGFALLGYLAGAEYDRIMLVVGRGGWVLLGAIVGGYVLFRLLRHRRARHRRLRAGALPG